MSRDGDCSYSEQPAPWLGSPRGEKVFLYIQLEHFLFQLVSWLPSHSTVKSLCVLKSLPLCMEGELLYLLQSHLSRLSEKDRVAVGVITSQICDFASVLFNLRELLSTQSSHSFSRSFQMFLLLPNISFCSPWFGTKIEESTSLSPLLCPGKMVCTKGLKVDSYNNPLVTALHE